MSGLTLYLYGRFLGLPKFGISSDLAIGGGACALVIAALCGPKTRKVLTRPAVSFLGRVSYSLYLLHGTVLFSFVYLGYGRAPWFMIGCGYIIVSIACAYLSYRLVEEPSIRLGKRVAHRLDRHNHSRSRPHSEWARVPGSST